MKVLQWSMVIPKEKQKDFADWFNSFAGPELGKFGAIKHDLYKVADIEMVGRQLVEKDQYIESIYFDDDYNISNYFSMVKNNPKTWKLSRMYEEEFGAKNIELRVLLSAS